MEWGIAWVLGSMRTYKKGEEPYLRPFVLSFSLCETGDGVHHKKPPSRKFLTHKCRLTAGESSLGAFSCDIAARSHELVDLGGLCAELFEQADGDRTNFPLCAAAGAEREEMFELSAVHAADNVDLVACECEILHGGNRQAVREKFTECGGVFCECRFVNCLCLWITLLMGYHCTQSLP